MITKGGKGGKFQPSSERGVVSNHGQWYELYRGNILYMGMSTQNVMLNEGVKISTTSCVTILHTFLCFAKVCIFFIHLKINLAQKECIYTQKLVEDVHQCLWKLQEYKYGYRQIDMRHDTKNKKQQHS